MTLFVKDLEEVDTAFYNLLRTVEIDGNPIDVTFFTPDVDILGDYGSRPALAMYRINPIRDVARWNNNQEIISSPVYDEKGRIIARSTRRHPEPWIIKYGVRAIFEKQVDGVKIQSQLMRLAERGAVIRIGDYQYNLDYVDGGVWGSGYKNFGRVEGGQRVFQERYSFQISIWLEVDEPVVKKTTQEISFNINTMDTKNKKK